MSKLLSNNPSLELQLDNFRKIAFETHVEAYCAEPGIQRLSMLDKVIIFTTVYPSDLFTENGLKQVLLVGEKQVEEYLKDPVFAYKQAQELSQNWELYTALMLEYLTEKDKTDPRKNNLQRNSLPVKDANELMKLFFGESIEYFKTTFGDQFTLPV